MLTRNNFYSYILTKYINKKMSILVVGANYNDIEVMKNNNLTNVVFSNFEGAIINDTKFEKIDMTKINYKDNSFDFVVAHAAIHHTSKPHASILEMYRVAKEACIIIEAKDSILMRFLVFFKLAEEYEQSAIGNGNNVFADYGGVDNSNIPNYVYRWTEREIIKLIKSYQPKKQIKIKFEYKYDFLNILDKIKNKILKLFIKQILILLKKILQIFLHKQANLFGIIIFKNFN